MPKYRLKWYYILTYSSFVELALVNMTIKPYICCVNSYAYRFIPATTCLIHMIMNFYILELLLLHIVFTMLFLYFHFHIRCDNLTFSYSNYHNFTKITLVFGDFLSNPMRQKLQNQVLKLHKLNPILTLW